MYFKCKRVLNHLLDNNIVYTVRRHRYPKIKDWITDNRGHKKIADVLVKEVGPLFDTESLNGQYLKDSGFSSLSEWLSEIYKLHKSDSFRDFYLYRVNLIGDILIGKQNE